MTFVRNVLRVYSYVFEAVLSLMALGAGGLAALSGNASLHIPWLPFDDANVVRWLLILGALGLLCVLLAISGNLRFLLLLFALAACFLLCKGLLLGTYTFNGVEGGRHALYLIGGSLLAVIGAIPMRRARR